MLLHIWDAILKKSNCGTKHSNSQSYTGLMKQELIINIILILTLKKQINFIGLEVKIVAQRKHPNVTSNAK